MSLLKQALDGTGYLFSHFGWTRMANATHGDFGVYAETGAADFEADSTHAERGTVYSVDYFTHDDSETPRTTIEAAFANVCASWNLVSIGYDEDTGYIHYNWEVGLYGQTSGVQGNGAEGSL